MALVAGKYEVLFKLAEGGMAEVLLVRARGGGSFEKYLVMKRLLPHLARDRSVRAMFLDEGRLAAQLHHENIAQVLDSGEADGTLFMTMEYLHGEDVRGLLRRTRELDEEGLPLDAALTIAVGAASGLHHAHEQVDVDGSPLGLVHRDVSSSNLIVTFSGGVKVVDFGIAFAARRMSETRTGTIKGKVAYMAPEQCLGHPLDRRTDLWGLGVVLYELTCGRRPFDRGAVESEYEVMTRIVEGGYTDPRDLTPGYPAALAELIRRALSVDPAGRFDSAEAMAIELERVAAELGLVLSQRVLARTMERLFGRRVEPWVPWAEAQKAGGDRGPRMSAQATQQVAAADVEAEAMWSGPTQAALVGSPEAVVAPGGSPAVVVAPGGSPQPVVVVRDGMRRAVVAPGGSADAAGAPAAASAPAWRAARRWLLLGAAAIALAALGASIALAVGGSGSAAPGGTDRLALSWPDAGALAGELPDASAAPGQLAAARADAGAGAGAGAELAAELAERSSRAPARRERSEAARGRRTEPGGEGPRRTLARDAGPGARFGSAADCAGAAKERLERVAAAVVQLEQGATGLLLAARRDLEAGRDLLGRGTPALRCDPDAPHPDRTALRRELAVLEHRVAAQERARGVAFRRAGVDLFFRDADSGAELDAAALRRR